MNGNHSVALVCQHTKGTFKAALASCPKSNPSSLQWKHTSEGRHINHVLGLVSVLCICQRCAAQRGWGGGEKMMMSTTGDSKAMDVRAQAPTARLPCLPTICKDEAPFCIGVANLNRLALQPNQQPSISSAPTVAAHCGHLHSGLVTKHKTRNNDRRRWQRHADKKNKKSGKKKRAGMGPLGARRCALHCGS